VTARKRVSPAGTLILGALAVLAAYAARLWNLNGTSLWYDEAFMLAHAREGIVEAVVGLFREDNALPLHGLLLAVWIRVAGEGEFAARYLSVLLSTIGTPLVIRLARAVGGRRRVSGLGAGIAYATLPILVYYGQEVRMYAPAMALAAAFAWVGWRLVRARGRRRRRGLVAAYVALGSLMMTAHLFAGLAWLSVGVWGTLVSLRSTYTQRRWWWANALLAVCAIPLAAWALWRVGADATGVSAIPTDALRWIPILFGIDQYMTQPWAALFTACAAAAALAGVIGALRTRRFAGALWLAISLTLPIAVLFLVTSVKAKWSERYLLASWGIALVVAIGNGWEQLLIGQPGRLRRRRPRGRRLGGRAVGALLLGAWVALATPAIVRQAEGTWALALQDEWHPRPDFRGVSRHIEAHDEDGDAIVVVGGYAAVAIEAYYDGTAHLFGLPPDTRVLDTRETLDLRALTVLAEEAGAAERLWLVLWQDRTIDPTGLVQSALVETCHRLPVGGNFTNVGLLLFSLEDCRPLDRLVKPQVPIGIAFAAPIRLEGYRLIRPDETWEVDLWWRTTGEIDEVLRVFVHLVDARGEIVSQHDHIAGADAYPTDQWRAGTEMRDRFFLDVAGGKCLGCELRIGLYTDEGRLSLADGTDTITIPVPDRTGN